jgi:hypothetical protein
MKTGGSGRFGTRWLTFCFPESETITREEYRRREAAGPAPVDPAADKRPRCPWCDKRFSLRRPNQSYCSRMCRVRWQNNNPKPKAAA